MMKITKKDWIDGLGLVSFTMYFLGSIYLLLLKLAFKEEIPSYMKIIYWSVALIFFVTLVIQKYIPEMLEEKSIASKRMPNE